MKFMEDNCSTSSSGGKLVDCWPPAASIWSMAMFKAMFRNSLNATIVLKPILLIVNDTEDLYSDWYSFILRIENSYVDMYEEIMRMSFCTQLKQKKGNMKNNQTYCR